MQGRSFTFRIPPDIDECLSERLKQLDMDALASYFVSLACYDLSIAKPHYATGDIHSLPPLERDKIFAEVKRAFKAGETLGGSWLEARVAAATKEAALPEPPPASKVGKNLRKRLAQSASKKTEKPAD